MNTFLADGWHGGPGPWILLVPLFWIGAFTVVRRVLWRRGVRGPRRDVPFGPRAGSPWGGPPQQGPAPSPLETLNRRYANGEIDEFEYRQRLDVLNGTDTTTA
ncbi:SHOCT domain-containing protein [Streptacidiphilus jiangxiensis]|uniref:Putative membrane protein n=1 Tax=Streptacidiphilus jiangxiensis TaxID=235985 RepID=A0A1H7Z934_STRJI|nr:SHOCT domain-containing protein [Streptacidiphilus jiangxiensis]SEM54009.1 putative membrane protein [Streptacidiphilus jiangxiensis]